MMSVPTTDDGTDTSLPSYTTFNTELDPSWDYYERDRSSTDVITSQSNNYTRPWEMETKDKGFEPFSKLPSFQSQFHSYSETIIPEPSLPQITPVAVPVSPSSAPSVGTGGSLTQLTPINPMQTGLTTLGAPPSFHTLTAVNTRTYPLVPAPIQARNIPSINQQYLEERHIQLYQPMTPFPSQNMVTVIKSDSTEYDGAGNNKNGLHHHHHHHTQFISPLSIKSEPSEYDHTAAVVKNNNGLHHSNYGAPISNKSDIPENGLHHHHHTNFGNGNGNGGNVLSIKTEPPDYDLKNGLHHTNFINPMSDNNYDMKMSKSDSPLRVDARKKERRKNRASSLESSAESESSAMDMGDGNNSGQVAAISSTASFKSPMSSMSMCDESDGTGGKQVSTQCTLLFWNCWQHFFFFNIVSDKKETKTMR